LQDITTGRLGFVWRIFSIRSMDASPLQIQGHEPQLPHNVFQDCAKIILWES